MIGSFLTFFIVLSILILVHELGHFVMAKRAGIWVEEFGFGIPPRLFGKKIGETIYSINALPFGGFVRLHGESTNEGLTQPKRAFMNKGKLTRVGILVAGVVMNFILAVVAFAIVYSYSGIPQETEDVKVVDVTPGSPAQTAGLISGDIVRKVDQKEVTTTTEFVQAVEEKKGQRVSLEVESMKGLNKETRRITLTPREDPPENEGPLGVVISNTEVYYPPVWQRPFLGIYYGFKEAVFWGTTVLTGFAQIFRDLFRGQAPQDLAGPVGIFAITTQAARAGTLVLLNFLGVLSVNLAILNILPFPALDGGRLLFIGIETLFGRKVLPRIENIAHAIGMAILITLLVAITAHDVQRLIAAGSINGFIDSILK